MLGRLRKRRDEERMEKKLRVVEIEMPEAKSEPWTTLKNGSVLVLDILARMEKDELTEAEVLLIAHGVIEMMMREVMQYMMGKLVGFEVPDNDRI